MVTWTVLAQGTTGNIRYITYKVTDLSGDGTGDICPTKFRQFFACNAQNHSDTDGLEVDITVPTSGRNGYVTIESETASTDDGRVTLFYK